MEVEARARVDLKVKAEDDAADVGMADDKPSYRSWKKKYRKMRRIFDQKMLDGEELHRLEQQALATARRLAVQKDRLLDLLLDVNNSGQIPPEKRIDLALDPPSDEDGLFLDIDLPSKRPTGAATPLKSYKKLLREVPHPTLATADRFQDLLADIAAGRDSPADPAQGQPHPPSFLTADDIDNYIWDIDTHLAAASRQDRDGNNNKNKPDLLPTLAPLANPNSRSSSSSSAAAGANKDAQRDFALRNPTSVYNWLRKHAPKTFLQDGEHDKDSKDKDDDGHTPSHHSRRGKSSASAAAAERGSARGSGSARGTTKRARLSAAAVAATESFDDQDDELLGGVATPSTLGGPASKGGGGGGGGGKRKRMVDDDPGYRPKGGSSRPAKKKKKSEGVEGTPTGKKPRKSAAGGGGGGGGGGDAVASSGSGAAKEVGYD